MDNIRWYHVALASVLIFSFGLVAGYNLKKNSRQDVFIFRDTLEKFYYSHHDTVRILENNKTIIKNNYEKETSYFHSVPDCLVVSYIYNRACLLLSDTVRVDPGKGRLDSGTVRRDSGKTRMDSGTVR